MIIDIMGQFDPFHRPTLARQELWSAITRLTLPSPIRALGAGCADQEGPSRVTIRDGRVDIALPDVNGLAAATSPEPEITVSASPKLAPITHPGRFQTWPG